MYAKRVENKNEQHLKSLDTTAKFLSPSNILPALTLKYRNITFLPRNATPLSEHELALAFFAAHLALKLTI